MLKILEGKIVTILLVIFTTLVLIALIFNQKKIYKHIKKFSIQQEHSYNQKILELGKKSDDIISKLNEIKASQDRYWVEKLVGYLKVYTTYDDNGEIKLIRMGGENDGGYIVPEKALLSADVLIGYGIAGDALFEEQFSRDYKKPSYGFDCSIKEFHSNEKLFHFVNQCIATNKHIWNLGGDRKNVATYGEQLDNLKLKDKKIFLKMDIEGGEYDAFGDIFQYASNITGIAVEMHWIMDKAYYDKAINLLARLNKDFILVHIHQCNFAPAQYTAPNIDGAIPGVMELTFINRALVTKYHLSNNQKHPTTLDKPDYPGGVDVPFEVIVPEEEKSKIYYTKSLN